MFGLGLAFYSRRSSALPPRAIRPPGAGSEARFLAACIRCGSCVRACPYDALALARLAEGPATGTPYFTPRNAPCEMCEDIPCVKACPTGALDPKLTDIARARMGVAVLLDQEACLNFAGMRCDTCYRACPLLDKAITLEVQHNVRTGGHAIFIPTVHSDRCTGCGKCEKVCVLEDAAIRVLPLALAKTATGPHDRFGWRERDASGAPLLDRAADVHKGLSGGLQ